MENEKAKCLGCGSERIVKVGKSPSGHQRYRCLEASCFVKTFQLDYITGGSFKRFVVPTKPKVWHIKPFEIERWFKEK